MSICEGKSSWPELVGTNAVEAAKIIESENSLVQAVVVLEGSPIIGNFNCGRVWVVVDENMVVVKTPVVG